MSEKLVQFWLKVNLASFCVSIRSCIGDAEEFEACNVKCHNHPQMFVIENDYTRGLCW